MYGSQSFAFLSMLALATASAIPTLHPRANSTATTGTTSAGVNIQTFNGSLPSPYSFPAPAVYYDASLDTGSNSKAFSIEAQTSESGQTTNAQTYNSAISALEQSCSLQDNNCNQASNDGSSGVTTQQCSTQQQACQQAAQTISKQYQSNGKRDGGKFRAGSSKAVTPGSSYEEEEAKRDVEEEEGEEEDEE